MSTGDLVLVVVLDGMRRDLIDPVLTPTLRGFLDGGCDFPESSSVFPSSTRVNASALGSGATPSRHGIVANKFFDASLGGGSIFHTGQRADILKAEAAAGGDYLIGPTLGDVLAAEGLRLAVVSSGSAGTTHLVNPRAARHRQVALCLRDWSASAPADFAAEMLARFGPIAPAGRPNAARMDQQTTMFLDGVWPRVRPDVAVLWYNDPDITFHHEGLGSPAAVAALRALDRAFARLLDWARSPAPGRAVQILLVSDHGHITARERIPAKQALAGCGLALAEAPGADALAGSLGYVGVLHAERHDSASLRRLVDWMTGQPWCGHIFSTARNEVEGIVPGTLARSLLLNDHARSPHLFCVMRADDSPNEAGISGSCYFDGEVPEGGSIHGGLHRREMNNLLALGGSAFHERRVVASPAGVVDVAPTVLHMLGLPVPAAMQGRVLAEALPGAQPAPEPVVSTVELAAPHGTMALRRARVGTTDYVVSGWMA